MEHSRDIFLFLRTNFGQKTFDKQRRYRGLQLKLTVEQFWEMTHKVCWHEPTTTEKANNTGFISRGTMRMTHSIFKVPQQSAILLKRKKALP